MLQRDRQIRTQVHQLTDACLFAASFWLAFAVRSSPTFTSWLRLESIPPEWASSDKVVWLYFALGLAAPLVLESQGFYKRPAMNLRRALFWPLMRGSLIVTVGMVLLMFYFKAPAPRGVSFIFIVFSCALVWSKEELLLAAMHSRVAKAQYKRRIILAGGHAETARLRKLLQTQGDDLEIAGEFNLAESRPQELIELLHEHSISGVLVSAKHAHFERVENVIKLCEVEGVEAWLVADFFATQIARASFDELSGHPLIVFRSTTETSWQMVAKMLLDFFGALLLLLVCALPMLAIALLIKLTSPGPVMFRQQRSGLNGSAVSIHKFRTMTTNAEQLKHELAAMNEMTGPVFKV